MSESPKLKAVLFDMDDTLIDWSTFTADWRTLETKHMRCVYDYLSEQGRPLQSSFEHVLNDFSDRVMAAWASARGSLRAPHMGHILMQTLQAHGFEQDERIAMAECLEAYDWGKIPGVELFADVPGVLQTLIGRGISIGIVTNAFQPMYLRDRELIAYDLLRFFPDVNLRISAADVGYLKPHPAIFEHALNALATRPEETVFVGDNLVADIGGSQQAGMKGVLRSREAQSSLVSEMIEPDATITVLDELLPLLDRWYGDW
jgi:HAD superfamily hydrolase (TIGR01549 family)